jgi:hypothetical protein
MKGTVTLVQEWENPRPLQLLSLKIRLAQRHAYVTGEGGGDWKDSYGFTVICFVDDIVSISMPRLYSSVDSVA